MLFQKLVEQHRVNLLVADGFGLTLRVASHQIGIHLGHILDDQAKGKRLRNIVLFVIAKTDRAESVERFAGSVHRLDVVFIPSRGYVTSAKPSGAGYGDRIRIGPNNGLNVEVDAADKATVVHVRARRPNTGDVARRSNTADGGVAIAGVVGLQRLSADGRVLGGSRVQERAGTDSRVEVAGRMVSQRNKTNGSVFLATYVGRQRLLTNGRVKVAVRIVTEGSSANGRVYDAGCII